MYCNWCFLSKEIFDILGYFSFSFIKVYCNVSIFGKCCEKYEGGCCNVRFRFVS